MSDPSASRPHLHRAVEAKLVLDRHLEKPMCVHGRHTCYCSDRRS